MQSKTQQVSINEDIVYTIIYFINFDTIIFFIQELVVYRYTYKYAVIYNSPVVFLKSVQLVICSIMGVVHLFLLLFNEDKWLIITELLLIDNSPAIICSYCY